MIDFDLPERYLSAIMQFMPQEYDLRIELCGVHVEIWPTHLIVTASDGKIMGTIFIPDVRIDAAGGDCYPHFLFLPMGMLQEFGIKRSQYSLTVEAEEGAGLITLSFLGKQISGSTAVTRNPNIRSKLFSRVKELGWLPPGRPSSYDPVLLNRLFMAEKILLQGKRKATDRTRLVIRQCGLEAGIVTLTGFPNFYGVIMPLNVDHNDLDLEFPDWLF
jgi:hypothetical protein